MRKTGKIRGTRSGFAFFVPDEGGEDLFVAADALGGAVHGDRVRVVVSSRGPHDFRPEVFVEEVVSRQAGGFTGNLFRLGKSWFVRPDSPLLPERIRVRLGPGAGVAGAKILFHLEGRERTDPTPIAAFDEMLGDGADARLDPVVLSAEYGLPTRFSDEAWREAEARASRRDDPEDQRREDFRGQFVVTIDPPDAKDFDDAVALEARDDGWRLTVHVADVSFYVPDGGALDAEAAQRGTSVYFPGSVVPMLPEPISTLAASLGPEEDRRTLSVQIDFDPAGARRAYRITRGWIHSRARLHYRQAQGMIEGREPASDELRETLRAMQRLADLLRGRRFAEGGFQFDLPEVEMRLGPDGVPTRMRRRESLETHHLIEEFMIAANRAVGAFAAERAAPFLYRVHQEPDATALERFLETALALLPGTNPTALSSLPRLRRWIESLPDSPLGRVVQRLFLRSMQKAIYAPVDLGHFGLGIREYCHFTSPIRRYPDLFVHRRVKELLDGRRADPAWEAVQRLALLCSRAEVNAEEAEREMNRLKVARFMERRLGEEYGGHVSGVSPLGLFVELDALPVEGFLPREELPSGFRLTDERLAFLDARSRRELRPGDALRVLVQRVDLRTRRVEFAPADRGALAPAPRRERAGASSSASSGRSGRGGRRGTTARGGNSSTRRRPKSGGGRGRATRAGSGGRPAGRGGSASGRPQRGGPPRRTGGKKRSR